MKRPRPVPRFPGTLVLGALGTAALVGGLPGCGDDGPTGSNTGGQGGSGGDGVSGAAGGGEAGEGSGAGSGSGGSGANGAGGAGGTGAGGSGGSAGAPLLPIEIEFRAVVGEQAFACDQTYDDEGSSMTAVRPRDLRFFVEGVRMIGRSGDRPVELDERPPFQEDGIALLDFEDGSGACGGTTEVNTRITGTVEEGDALGLGFVISVPEPLNHDTQASTGPLAARGMHFGNTRGYRFMRAELVGTTAGDATFHLGSASCDAQGEGGGAGQASMGCDRANRVEVRLQGFDAEQTLVVVDVGALFAEVDLSGTFSCTSQEAECEAPFAALGRDFSSGAETDGQTVFSVAQKQ